MALTASPQWKALHRHRTAMEGVHMRDLFAADPHRFKRFSLTLDEVLFDYSKNRVTEETMNLLTDLARAADVPGAVEAMFRGDKLNVTEQRSVLHVALRRPDGPPIIVDGVDATEQAARVLAKMDRFVADVRSGRRRGFRGRPFTDVVNIGIGGSHVGPRLVAEALKPYSDGTLKVHFVSNVDPAAVTETLKKLDPERTLFLVASKSFTTQETMLNARAARSWLLSKLHDEAAVARHFVALSTNERAVHEFGIPADNMFELWDWVGGRYSLWSAIGLSAALYLGMEIFRQLLEGAHAADEHFRTAPLERNIPVVMALLGVWYINFWGSETYAFLPYDHYLTHLPEHLRQLDRGCPNSRGI